MKRLPNLLALTIALFACRASVLPAQSAAGAGSGFDAALREQAVERFRVGDFQAAYVAFRPWLREHPEDQGVRLLAGVSAVRLGRYREADQLLEGLPIEDLRVAMIRSELLLARGDIEEGIAILEPLEKAHPPPFDAEIRRLLGRAYVVSHRDDEAVELLRDHAAGSEVLSLILAEAYFQRGEIPQAIETLASLEVLSAQGAGELGRYLLLEGRAEEALEPLRRAAADDSQEPSVWLSLSQALLAVGETEEARAAAARAQKIAAEKAASSGPSTEAPAARRLKEAQRLRDEGRYDEALGIVREELAVDPKRAAFLHERIRNLYLLGRYDEALEAADEGVRLAPDLGDSFFLRALTFEAKNDPEAAEGDLRKAIEVNPKHRAARNQLAVLLARAGRSQEAEGLLRELLAEDPDDSMAKENLRLLLGTRAEGRS